MQKKLLAMAVAGALAAPGAALAASSVTITGYFQLSYVPYYKISGRVNEDSQDRVQDESSRIWFRVVEDLGGGLQAIAQIDWRIALDNGSDGTSGANWVGLRSKSWGEIGIGRYDLHYIYTEDQSYSRGGSLKMTNTSLISFTATGDALANASRTPNTIRWFSPNWNGFTAVVAYSTSPLGASSDESEIGATASGGYGWNIAPQYNAKNWGIGYSYWQGKADPVTTAGSTTGIVCTGTASDPVAGTGGVVSVTPACAAGAGAVVVTSTTTKQVKQRGDRFNAHYQWGGLRIGFVWDSFKIENEITGVDTNDRDAWSIPIRYSWGKHNIFGHYTEADDDDEIKGKKTGAKMFAIGYAYDLSKRTSISINYAEIKNDRDARYNLFTTSGGLGSADSGINTAQAGEDPKQLAITVKHSF